VNLCKDYKYAQSHKVGAQMGPNEIESYLCRAHKSKTLTNPVDGSFYSVSRECDIQREVIHVIPDQREFICGKQGRWFERGTRTLWTCQNCHSEVTAAIEPDYCVCCEPDWIQSEKKEQNAKPKS